MALFVDYSGIHSAIAQFSAFPCCETNFEFDPPKPNELKPIVRPPLDFQIKPKEEDSEQVKSALKLFNLDPS